MSNDTVLYGITACDTVRKARRWLEETGIAFSYHDFRKDGLSESDLVAWVKTLGWEALINRSGTTFRKLSEVEKGVSSAQEAIRLMLSYPTIIKRPVLVRGGAVTLGFKPEVYGTLFSPG